MKISGNIIVEGFHSDAGNAVRLAMSVGIGYTVYETSAILEYRNVGIMGLVLWDLLLAGRSGPGFFTLIEHDAISHATATKAKYKYIFINPRRRRVMRGRSPATVQPFWSEKKLWKSESTGGG